MQNCIFLLNAGHETTTNLIGNTVDALLRFPGELARLKADPGLIKSCVEEGLRFESSNQLGNRRLAADLEIGGERLAAGTYIHIGIGAANRDPAQFPEPDRFDAGREPNRHFAFGSGVHMCLGAVLARLEGTIAIGRLVSRSTAWRATAPMSAAAAPVSAASIAIRSPGRDRRDRQLDALLERAIAAAAGSPNRIRRVGAVLVSRRHRDRGLQHLPARRPRPAGARQSARTASSGWSMPSAQRCSRRRSAGSRPTAACWCRHTFPAPTAPARSSSRREDRGHAPSGIRRSGVGRVVPHLRRHPGEGAVEVVYLAEDQDADSPADLGGRGRNAGECNRRAIVIAPAATSSGAAIATG